MKKFNRIVGTAAAAAALLLSIAACSNSFTPQTPPEQTQNNAQSTQVTLETPLTLKAIEAGAVITFKNKAAGAVTYKVNGGAPQTIAKNSTGTITLATACDKVEFFGDNKTYATSKTDYSNISCTKDCYVYGNIMSLVQSEGFKDATELKQSYTFFSLFGSNAHIKNKDGEPLLLPATKLATWCYARMFIDCTSLTAAPALPATSLADYCYTSMFRGCSSLASAPELPATSLATWCYAYMFIDCTSLTAAPSLPATWLSIYCYEGMFSGCTSLTAAPSLPATTLEYACYGEMFSGCTSLNSVTCLATNISANACTTNWLDGVAANGTFTKAAGMTGWTTGKSGIPNGWTVK